MTLPHSNEGEGVSLGPSKHSLVTLHSPRTALDRAPERRQHAEVPRSHCTAEKRANLSLCPISRARIVSG